MMQNDEGDLKKNTINGEPKHCSAQYRATCSNATSSYAIIDNYLDNQLSISYIWLAC